MTKNRLKLFSVVFTFLLKSMTKNGVSYYMRNFLMRVCPQRDGAPSKNRYPWIKVPTSCMGHFWRRNFFLLTGAFRMNFKALWIFKKYLFSMNLLQKAKVETQMLEDKIVEWIFIRYQMLKFWIYVFFYYLWEHFVIEWILQRHCEYSENTSSHWISCRRQRQRRRC